MPKNSSSSELNILNLVNHSGSDSPSVSPPDSAPQTKTPVKSKFKLRFPRIRPNFRSKRLLLLIPLFLLLLLGLSTLYPLLQIRSIALASEPKARAVYEALKHQDLLLSKQHLTELESDLHQIKRHYTYLTWLKFTPLYWHYTDGEHLLSAATSGLEASQILLNSIEPYADVIGFTGEGTFTGGTAEDRIIKILETLEVIVPSLDQVSDKMQQLQTSIDQINPRRYPFTLKGHKVEDLLTDVQKYSNLAVTSLDQIKPLLTVLPDIAGLDSEKKYLVLFQNDAELRPTGGFLTAYAVLRIDKGRVFPENNDDIYTLDAKFTKRLEPPAPLKKYLNVFYWNLRDMNWSPDFKNSMDTFLEYYQQVPGEPDNLDGVIAVDTQVLADLITVLGPIEVPGYGRFTSDIDERCNCPQVIYQLETLASKPVAHVRTDRKAFLGPMMQTILLEAYGSPKEVWPGLFQTMFNNVINKHVLLYMFDDTAQTAIEQVNLGSRIQNPDGDFFMVVDTNLGGAKQNLFITEEIEIDITPEVEHTTHQVTLTYDNPAPWDNCNLEAGELCLNGRYIDYVRIYLPPGSTLVEALGFDQDTVQVTEDLGKTVIEGVFRFDPESRAKLKLTYQTPPVSGSDYRLYIQKQAGKKAPKYTVIFNQQDKQEFELNTDKQLTF